MFPARVWRSIRFGAAAVAVLAGSLITGAAPADAADSLEFTGSLFTEVIRVDVTDGSTTVTDAEAGAMTADVNGEVVVVYCIDFDRLIDIGDVLEETTWEAVGVPNLATVASILAGYDATDPAGDPAGFALSGSGPVRSAAIQAAIWSYTDGLTTTAPSAVVTNVATIRAAVAAGVLPTVADIAPTVQIDGTSTTEVGSIAGPFVVTGTPSPITLTPGADTQVVTWPDGDPISGPVASGTSFGLVRSTPGAATVEAVTPTVLLRNQVFGNGTIQPLMVITAPSASAAAQASATFLAATTTTTVEETTTTTGDIDDTTTTTGDIDDTTTTTGDIDDTTSTTGDIDDTTSTTSPAGVAGGGSEQPGSVLGASAATQSAATQSLPNTGSSTGLFLAGAVVLMAVGGGLLAASRQPATVAASSHGQHRRRG